MKCSKAQGLISAYIDGELDGRESRSLEQHLSGCRDCTAELEEVRALQDLFKQAEPFKAPFGFSTRVMATVKERRKKAFSGIPLFARFAEVLIAALIIAAGVISGSFLMSTGTSAKGNGMASFLSLDVFDPVPPGSIGGAYLAMTEVQHEK